MNDLNLKLESLVRLSAKVRKEGNQWKERALQAESELADKRSELERLRLEYEKLDKNLKVYNLATLIDVPDQEDLKKTISEMIRDIDGCLAMLEE